MSDSAGINFTLIGRYLLAYLAWIALAIIGFWLIFQIRLNLLDILTYFLEDPNSARDTWVARAIDRWFIMVAGGVWVFCITLLEGYFRNSIPRNLLLVRLRKVTIITVVVAALSFGLRAVFNF